MCSSYMNHNVITMVTNIMLVLMTCGLFLRR